MKKIIFFSVLILLIACSQTEQKSPDPYSIEQFYKNTRFDGGSYGGFMTMAAMAFAPDEFKVGVNLFGVTNWLRTLKSIPPYWQSQRAALFAEMGDPSTTDSIHLYNISPLFHAKNIKNPIMVLQGANDPRVLQVESDEIVAAVKNNNVPVEYIIFPDEGHGFVKKENEINGYGKILEFLDRYLKGETGQEISAIEQCKKLGRGVNIIGYDDELWEDFTNGRFKEKYFKMIKEAGFTNIRINMHPFSHMDSSYKINDKWLETLDWAVKNGLEANLMIILDLHEFHAMADDPVARKEMFLSFWRQLALRYKDLPDDVIFEILNEPNGKLTAVLWNSFLVETVELIRVTNPNRTLMIGPGNWNGIESLPGLVLPENDKNIIVTVHFYHPMKFTHQGAPWSEQYANLSGITWTGTEEEKEEINSKLQVAADWAEANDRPIYLGEFGAYEKADMDSRARYTAYVARTAEKLGFSWGYWQFDSDFILYDIDKEEWVTPILNALTDRTSF